MGRKAIILDLGGTLCDEVDHGGDLTELRLIPGSASAIRSANEHGFQTVLAAQQETPAPETIREMLACSGARLDAIYPRHAGFFDRARDEMGIDLKASYMVGDRRRDVEDGQSVGATSVLVLTGRGKAELEDNGHAWAIRPDHVATDLSSAVTWILEREASR